MPEGTTEADLLQIARVNDDAAGLTPQERAIIAFAAKVARAATEIAEADVADRCRHGLSDPEIFDVATAAAVRCFCSKTLDALGTPPDRDYLKYPATLRAALIAGRPTET